MRKFFLVFWTIFSFSHPSLLAMDALIGSKPLITLHSHTPHYSLINSVDCHPHKNLFCATYTHSNWVVIFKLNNSNSIEIVQSLHNPISGLSEPQHAAFSPDGKTLVVANWTNQTLTIYKLSKEDLFTPSPAAIIPSPPLLMRHKPHGIAFSPCGKWLAIAYGAAYYHGTAVGLYQISEETGYKLASILEGPEQLLGIPKGITFSPDSSCLLVTFSDVNSIAIFDVQNDKIALKPRQIVQGSHTQISRPEDIKISPNKTLCAISNSDSHTISFYRFDPLSNRITQETPCYLLKNPQAELCFPHGLAFSSDGHYLFVTEFGPVKTSKEGNIEWDNRTPANLAKIHLYKIVYSGDL